MHDGVRLIGIVQRLKWRAGRGRKLHGLRQHGDKVLQGIKRFGIEIGLSGVGKRVGHLKLREAGPQRKQEGVAGLPVVLGDGRGINRLTAGRHSRRAYNLRAFGEIELEIVFVHLRARRLGRVLNRKHADDFELSFFRLYAHDVGDDGEIAQFFGNVVDLDFD